MTKAEYTKAARKAHLWHMKQEKKWRPRIQAALDKNVDSFINYAQSNSIVAAVKVIDTLVEAKPIVDVLKELYVSVGMAKAKDVRKQLQSYGKKSALDDFLGSMNDSILQFFFNYVATYLVLKILATQRKRILVYLAKELEPDVPEEQIQQELVSNPELVQQLLSRVRATGAVGNQGAANNSNTRNADTSQASNGPTGDQQDADEQATDDEFYRTWYTAQEAQALLDPLRVEASGRGVSPIARTEITRALNYAAYQAAMKMPFYVLKTWLSLRDNQTRVPHQNSPWDHWSPLGQTVALEDPYIISGENLMYPGDPKGSPGNLVGCRCGQEFSPRLDSKGRPIPKPGVHPHVSVILPTSGNRGPTITI